MKLFFLVFLSLLLFITYLLGRFYIDPLNITNNYKIGLYATHLFFTIMMILTPIIYRLYPVKNPGKLYQGLQWTGYTILGSYFILLSFIPFNGLILFLANKILKDNTILINELHGFLSIGTLIITLVMTIRGYFVAHHGLRVKRQDIYLDNLPDSFVGFSIVQLSDIHIGQTIKNKYLEKIVNLVNELNPDIVAITGDTIDGPFDQLEIETQSFKKLRSKYGIFWVPGNHEGYWGLDSWCEHFRKLNFQVLLNEHKKITIGHDSLLIGGVHDIHVHYTNPEYISDPKKAFTHAEENHVKILLAHQPRSIYKASEANVDLQLSGHTHSGQFFPSNIFIYLFQPFVKGLGKYKNTWIYVNTGTGYWGPPNRFGAAPEVSLLTLKKASKALTNARID